MDSGLSRSNLSSAAAEDAKAMTVMPGEMNVTARVQVVYKILSQ